MIWLLIAAILILWTAVAVWRAVVFVREDMLDSWRNNEGYSDELYREAVIAGFISGIAWPISAPFRRAGDLIYGWAHSGADKRFTGEGRHRRAVELDITSELEKIPPDEADVGRPSRAQLRLQEQAAKERRAYAQRLAEQTDVGDIPPYREGVSA